MSDIEAVFDLSQREQFDAVFEINVSTHNHNTLLGRDDDDCHPISAITGLEEALENAGQVKDVEVDGQSVVNQNGVAEIDLTGKQDVIDDLSQIRAGAELGATAVQPSDIGNATLDIQKNGVTVNTFTANDKTDKTVNITVPTKPSDIDAATSEQGALADTALQPEDITTGTANGTISVNGSDVQVKGLGSAAYTSSDSYATSGQGTLADSALQPSDVVNNTTSTATDAPLSANMGKSLQDQVDNLKARGRFLALWNCETGLAQSNPPQTTYTYQTGDYFVVGTVAPAGGTDYRPSGSSYTTGVASTVVETEDVAVNDVYYYDGTNWSLQINTQKEISFGSIAGDPYDNTNLASALNDKVPTTRTVNGKALSSDISLDASDVGALPDSTVIPTVNNATLTIQKNGTTVSTFTANASSNVTANITVPTDTNDLTNGAGYITGINSTDVTTALGYTPYDSSNPNGYTSNTGTVTSVNNVSPVSGNVTLSIPTVNNSTITLTQGGVTKGSFTLNQSSAQTIDLDAGGGSDVTLEDIAEAGINIAFTNNAYTNYTVVGSPTISSDYVLSNISSSNYVYTTSPISSGTSFEIVFKVRTPATIPSADYPVFSFSTGGVGSGKDVFLEGSTKKFCQWDGSHKVSGTSTIQPDTDYIVKLTYDGSNYKLYVNETLEYTTSYAIASSGNMYVGIFGSDQFWIGSVYLKDCNIKSNGEYLWRACIPVGKTAINSDIEGFTAAEVNTIWESVV